MPTDTFDIAVDADDGYGYKIGSDWGTLNSNPYTDEPFGDTICSTARAASGPNFYIVCGFLRFDTSSIPDDATILSASLKLYCLNKGAPDGATFGADFYDFGGEPSVEADWETVSSGNAVSSISPGSLTTGAVNTIPLTGLTGLSKTGYTGIRIAPKESGQPTGDNFIDFASREHATGAAPQLEVTYAVAGQHLAPSADSVDGTWTDQAAGTALAAAIDEASFSDTDYIQSVDSPSNAGCRVKLATGSDPAISTGHVIHWRIRKSTTGQTVDMTVKLYQGGGNSLGAGTLIATRTRSGISTSFATFDETLTGTEADAITNYGDLYLEFYATAS